MRPHTITLGAATRQQECQSVSDAGPGDDGRNALAGERRRNAADAVSLFIRERRLGTLILNFIVG